MKHPVQVTTRTEETKGIHERLLCINSFSCPGNISDKCLKMATARFKINEIHYSLPSNQIVLVACDMKAMDPETK